MRVISSVKRRFASSRAASTILMFFIASIPISVIPHCFPPDSSPEPRSVRSISESSNPFFAVVSAFSRSNVFVEVVSEKR